MGASFSNRIEIIWILGSESTGSSGFCIAAVLAFTVQSSSGSKCCCFARSSVSQHQPFGNYSACFEMLLRLNPKWLKFGTGAVEGHDCMGPASLSKREIP